MKVICVYNQKGGVGKTTTVVNLAAALGQLGKKVLVLDMDPQGNATSGFGIDKQTLQQTIYDFLLGDEVPAVMTEEENVSILPATGDLSGAEVELLQFKKKESTLKNLLQNMDGFDFVLVDCPPSLGILSINALVASDAVIIPIQCEYYALEGVGQLMATIQMIRKGLNPSLTIEGVLLSMFDGRNNLALEVVEEVKKYFKDKVFTTVIPRNIRLAEAPSYGMSAVCYDPKSKGALAYMKVAKEVASG